MMAEREDQYENIRRYSLKFLANSKPLLQQQQK